MDNNANNGKIIQGNNNIANLTLTENLNAENTVSPDKDIQDHLVKTAMSREKDKMSQTILIGNDSVKGDYEDIIVSNIINKFLNSEQSIDDEETNEELLYHLKKIPQKIREEIKSILDSFSEPAKLYRENMKNAVTKEITKKQQMKEQQMKERINASQAEIEKLMKEVKSKEEEIKSKDEEIKNLQVMMRKTEEIKIQLQSVHNTAEQYKEQLMRKQQELQAMQESLLTEKQKYESLRYTVEQITDEKNRCLKELENYTNSMNLLEESKKLNEKYQQENIKIQEEIEQKKRDYESLVSLCKKLKYIVIFEASFIIGGIIAMMFNIL